MLVVDPDPTRRERFLAAVTPTLAPVSGLVAGELALGRAVIRWQAAPSAPIDRWREADAAAVVWGDALTPGTDGRCAARALHAAWCGAPASPVRHDGFFAAVALDAGAVVLGGDLLGLFPLYVAAAGDTFVAATSPALVAAHPLVDGTLDLEGIVGHLLTGGPFDGRTVRRGVRRVAAGARVRWSESTGLHEGPPFDWPHAPVQPERSEEVERERFFHAQGEAVRRHTALHGRVSLLLSGGRDSRLLAGHLVQQGRSAHTITLGDATDHDATCAAAVARTLRLPHRVHAVRFDDFVAFADRTVRWEQLSGSLSSMHAWAAVDALTDDVTTGTPRAASTAHGRATAHGVLSGYLLEGRHLAPPPAGREPMLAWTHARALSPAVVTALLRAEHRHLVPLVISRVQAAFDSLAPAGHTEPAETSWRWLMAVYARFHPGAVPWRLSFGAWPILPILDQALLDTTLSMPWAYLANRRLQDALLRTRFPALARLPLDRNAPEVRPLVESWRARLLARARRRLASHVSAPLERRYYARMYDFDNAGWRAVRAAAEPGREALHAFFEPDALAALVPPGGAPAAHDDPITDGFGPRMLTGLMRWQVLSAGSAPDP